MCYKIDRSTYIAAKHSVATSIKALVGRHVTHIWRSSLRDEVEDNPHWWAYLQLMCPSNSKDHFEKKNSTYFNTRQSNSLNMLTLIDVRKLEREWWRYIFYYIRNNWCPGQRVCLYEVKQDTTHILDDHI